MKWYKDRDFPEVKLSNADVLAVIENPKQLERVIQLQNDLVDKLWETENQTFKAKGESSTHLAQAMSLMKDIDSLKKRIKQLESIQTEVDYIAQKLLDRQCEGSLESRSGLMGMRYACENVKAILEGKEKPYGGKGE